jgi:hypothetical protein
VIKGPERETDEFAVSGAEVNHSAFTLHAPVLNKAKKLRS